MTQESDNTISLNITLPPLSIRQPTEEDGYIIVAHDLFQGVEVLSTMRNKPFIENVKALLGFRAKGREIMEGDKEYQLREGSVPYKALFRVENDDIGPENTYFWDIKPE